MKFLITGGAGYIGSILTKDLLDEGHEVVVVDNFGYEQNSLAHVCSEKKLKIINLQLNEIKIMILFIHIKLRKVYHMIILHLN